MNSKFIYVEKQIERQLIRLYRDVMEQKCALEQQTLRNVLSFKHRARRDGLLEQILNSPRYTAVMTGEVIHLIKCLPVECRLRHTDTYYGELSVTFRNASIFFLPRSRIITRKCIPCDCNAV